MNIPGLLEMINKFGFVGIMSFGLTYITIKIYERKYSRELSSISKMLIQGGFAFVLLFVPLEVQSVVLQKIEIAIGVVAGSSAFWQIRKG